MVEAMSPAPGLLAVLTRPALRDVVDRVAAAVGIRAVHIEAAAVSRNTWSAAAGVLLDEAAAVSCGRAPLPRRAHVIVLSGAEPTGATWQAALSVGAARVLWLPGAESELVSELAEAGEAARDGCQSADGAVVAVAGGRGGAGASLFATALGRVAGEALLVDFDPCSGGIDLLAGTENTPGLRWPDLALQGGRLNWSAVRAALPARHGVHVLSAARRGHQVDAAAAAAVLDAGRRGGVTVICDLPRALTGAAEAALATADLAVLVTPCDVRACAAATASTPALRAVNPNVGLVVRGPSPGGLRAAEIADVTGLPLLAAMRAEPRLTERLEHGGLRLPRRSALATAARRVLQVLPARQHAATPTAGTT